MKNKKIYLLVGILLVCSAIGLGFWSYYLNNNINYQMKMLTLGSTKQKLIAADFLGEKKVITAIPLLVQNIDNINSSIYFGSPKSPESVSCCASFALESITGIKLGDTCCFNCGDKQKQVILDWQDWYKNEYPAWSEAQNNK